MKYLLITPGYPSESNPYGNAFVHGRVINYIKAGLNIEVFSVDRKLFSKRKKGARYIYDGVEIEQGNVAELEKKLSDCQYDKILIHFALKRVVACVLKTLPGTPVIIWCHGVDVISWHRRLYNLRMANIIKFMGYAVLNTWQRIFLHYAAVRYANRITFVFVSNWLKTIAQRDMWLGGRIKNHCVIPNIIDETVFAYREKSAADRLNILSIRSFESRKYANDQTVKAIKILEAKPYFNELKFMLCGNGRLWKRILPPLAGYKNVILERRFFTHQEIIQLHATHGVMLMPSRQDTHGVSTCEGMSSGLVPISSDNSAIPEYVPVTCGYLTNNAQEIADAIDDIYYHTDKFIEYSKKAAEFIRQTCGVDIVIPKELALIRDELVQAAISEANI